MPRPPAQDPRRPYKVTAAAAAATAALATALTMQGEGTVFRAYDDARPYVILKPGDPIKGTLLATCALNATAFASAVPVTGTSASITANSITQDSAADASGTAGYYRALKSDGTTAVDQGTIGTSAADMIVPSTTVTSGVPFAISSYVITQTC